MTKGIHHITAIASDAKQTVDFYTKILGLRLVKKTVNQDDVGTYHLFFGDRLGHPGMDLTFFIFQPSMQGKPGNGLVTKVSFAVLESSLDFWQKRFSTLNIKHEKLVELFDRKRLLFFDPDGLELELVGVKEKELETSTDIWTTKEITREHAIHHLHSATLSVSQNRYVAPILNYVFGYIHQATHKDVELFSVSSQRGQYLELHQDVSADPGFNASGTVHHIAFRAKDAKEQLAMRNKVLELGLYPTEVIDRFYFKSVYFRIPAGILFEIATDGPGFTADEKETELGKKLALPPFLESQRKTIEANLPEIL